MFTTQGPVDLWTTIVGYLFITFWLADVIDRAQAIFFLYINIFDWMRLRLTSGMIKNLACKSVL
jgi:hypothetical protein